MFAPGGQPRIDRQMPRAKAEELDRTIRKLPEMRDGLRHALPVVRRATWNAPPPGASYWPHLERLEREEQEEQ